jgi:hypothetical protein
MGIKPRFSYMYFLHHIYEAYILYCSIKNGVGSEGLMEGGGRKKKERNGKELNTT